MTWRFAALLSLLITSSIGVVFASDTVKLDNEVTGQDSGVIAWGKTTVPKKNVVSPVDIGAMDPGVPKQVVAFTLGRPPALDAAVNWTNGDDQITIAYPPVYEIPIQYWILCGGSDCSAALTKKKRARLAGYLVWANERLRKERVGIQLYRAGRSKDWISDQTQLKGATKDYLLNLDITNCSEELAEKTRGLKTANAFNVYMVQSVNHNDREGNACETDDSSVVGYRALFGTMLHELGHNLSLGDGMPISDTWLDNIGGEKNIMCKISTKRKYFSEGQVFRIHFSDYSGLNHSLFENLPKPLPPNRTTRDCDASPVLELPCPAIDTLLWSGF